VGAAVSGPVRAARSGRQQAQHRNSLSGCPQLSAVASNVTLICVRNEKDLTIMESFMHRRSFLALAACALPLLPLCGPTWADDGYRISDPVTHANLTVYFVHGASSSGAVPLTLAEALSAKAVRVLETGSVNELAIENLSDEEIFVQSGDIVKGGRQDRVLSVSLVLPPHSGIVPIAAFCVEHGRWSKRGFEDAREFSSAAAAVPSRAAKLAMQPQAGNGQLGAPSPAPDRGGAGYVATRQQRVWDEVARVQNLLSEQFDAPVAAPESRTSLQLALENERLKKAQEDYVAALKAAGEKDTDIVGYVFAINGKLNSADLYPSNGLFRKMWAKLLTANATEAIAAKAEGAASAPSSAEVAAFLKAAEGGAAGKQALTQNAELEIRNGDQALYLETRRADGTWVYRSYVAK
jgi:hypothetical protein